MPWRLFYRILGIEVSTQNLRSFHPISVLISNRRDLSNTSSASQDGTVSSGESIDESTSSKTVRCQTSQHYAREMQLVGALADRITTTVAD